MICRAAVALPYDNRRRATAGRRGKLHLMAVAAQATPDWSSLVIAGPTQVVGLRGRVSFEWTATLIVDRKLRTSPMRRRQMMNATAQ